MRNYISSEELAKIEYDLGNFVASCNNINEKDFEGEFILRINPSNISVTRNISKYYSEPTIKPEEIAKYYSGPSCIPEPTTKAVGD